MDKLQKIEDINNFINEFAEENKNVISIQKIEEDIIDIYLEKSQKDDEGNCILKEKFDKFCQAYNKITIVSPYNMNSKQLVKYILNDDKEESAIFKNYENLIYIQNEFLEKVINDYNKVKSKQGVLVKNAIKQIQKNIPIQTATKADVFEFNVKNNIIVSFEELFSFYSFKNIFNKYNDKINYTNYSNIKFKLANIEQELIDIILTGKKLFSKKQITYQFYLDPYRVEEKTKKLEKLNDIYEPKNLTENEKELISKDIHKLKKVFLPNLEILIDYLIKKNKYQPTYLISDIKFHSNLYLNQEFIRFFSDFKISINKLTSLYEYSEEECWKFIADRYVNKTFQETCPIENFRAKINNFIKNEDNRELKSDILASLLIKFICRYLPYAKEEMQSDDLFGTLLQKNLHLSPKIKEELESLKKEWGIQVKYAYNFTDILTSFLENNKISNEKKLNQSLISIDSQNPTEENIENEEEESEEERNF